MLNKALKDITKPRGNYPRNAVGIEVEAEKAPADLSPWSNIIFKYWEAKEDGSLVRGVELVSKPTDITLMNKTHREEMFSELESFFELNRVIVSERASTHVHFNCRDRTVLSILNMVVGYLLLENVLLEACSEDRRGNHFCLAFSDSMALVDNLINKINAVMFPFPSQEFKYSGLNLGRLRDLGTLEVRIMGALNSARDVYDWASQVSLLFQSFDGAYHTPATLLNTYAKSPLDFLFSHVPADLLEKIRRTNTLDGLVEKMDSQVALCLPIAQIDWEKASESYDAKRPLKATRQKIWFVDDGADEVDHFEADEPRVMADAEEMDEDRPRIRPLRFREVDLRAALEAADGRILEHAADVRR